MTSSGAGCVMRRAHLGGRSLEGTTQAIFARRQLEQGDCLSQRTFRLRHTTQLRGLEVRPAPGVDADGSLFTAGDLAFFSALEAKAPATVALDDENVVSMGALEILAAGTTAGFEIIAQASQSLILTRLLL